MTEEVTIRRHLDRRNFHTLVLIPQFAIFVGGDPWEKTNWLLKSYHTKEHLERFIEINKAGIQQAAEYENSLLIASGTSTDGRTTLTEAQGFEFLAESLDWFGYSDVRSRFYPELFATSSYLNLIYSICRFFEITGNYPQQIICPGLSYKQHRFNLHRLAIRYPGQAFRYRPICDPPQSDLVEAIKAEVSTVKEFMKFPHGRGSTESTRNKHIFLPSYDCTNPLSIKDLLHQTGKRQVFGNPLPWRPWPEEKTEKYRNEAKKSLEKLEEILQEQRIKVRV